MFFSLQHFHRSIMRFAIAILLSFTLAIGPTTTVWGQISPSTPVVQNTNQPPPGVQRLGAIEVATVKLDDKNLFQVVSPTVWNRSSPGNQIPVEDRVEEIEANLNRVITFDPIQTFAIPIGSTLQSDLQKGYYTNFDPKTLQVFVSQLDGNTIIVAKDAYHSVPLQLLTITQLDANYYGLSVNQLAQQLQSGIYQQLLEQLNERLPGAIKQQIKDAFIRAIVTIGISLLLWLLRRLLLKRDRFLATRQAAVVAESKAKADTTTSSVSHTSYLLEFRHLLQKQFTLKRRRNLVAFLRWLLIWGQFIVWIGGIAAILFLFPLTQQLALQLLSKPLQFLLLWLLVGLADRMSNQLLDRISKNWQDYHFLDFQFFTIADAQRKSLRISTTISAIKGLKTFVVWAVAIGWVLQNLGVPIESVLAGGAIIAFALSLGFQNLVKDLVNGCLILWEDQYGIGDVVAIVNTSGSQTGGLVENMNLRVTQLRNDEGRLITIPNSTIAQVDNLTRIWSRVNFTIEVAYETNIKMALALLQEIAQQMYREPKWRDRMVGLPEVLGVDNLAHTGMTIRVWIKTQPLQQWAIGRELRLRVRVAFEEHGIQIGIPQQALWGKNVSFPVEDRGDGRGDAE
jgi:moderate conductance mechanosensitive channel